MVQIVVKMLPCYWYSSCLVINLINFCTYCSNVSWAEFIFILLLLLLFLFSHLFLTFVKIFTLGKSSAKAATFTCTAAADHWSVWATRKLQYWRISCYFKLAVTNGPGLSTLAETFFALYHMPVISWWIRRYVMHVNYVPLHERNWSNFARQSFTRLRQKPVWPGSSAPKTK